MAENSTSLFSNFLCMWDVKASLVNFRNSAFIACQKPQKPQSVPTSTQEPSIIENVDLFSLEAPRSRQDALWWLSAPSEL